MKSRTVKLNVNGRTHDVALPPNVTLLQALHDLGYTDVKNGCEKGDCGACAVLLDGQAVNSCLTLAWQAEGAVILTAAGLGTLAHPHPLQAAFADTGAIQCGYCTPGQIISAKALLDRNPHPSDPEIREALSGNLCRCTGYGQVVEAVRAAAESGSVGVWECGSMGTQDSATFPHPSTPSATPIPPHSHTVVKSLPETHLPPLRQVGKPLRRVDALGKAVGATVYTGDFTMPQMLHAKVLRSTEPSARIVRLDASRARALPGVACVLTAAELPNARLVTDMPGQTGQKQRAGSDAPVLAGERVRFRGEPLALVAAETQQIAEQALELIEVELERLPEVFDPLEALALGAPVVNEPDNVVTRWKIRRGDVEAGFAMADLVVENTFRVPFVDHAYMEPEAGVAWTDERGVINIRVCTQVIEHFRSIARAVGVPQNKIRIQGTMVGGGFGGKEDITVEIFLALLTKHTGRPVRLAYTREESLLSHAKRHPFVITHRTGVKKDGRITASQIDLIADSGAYPYLSPYVLLYATIMSTGPYRIDNVKIDSRAVATNNPFTSAFRGFGGPQACFAHEQQMDLIAEALGMDSLDLRRINYLRTGDVTCTGQPIESAAWLEETATRALAALGEKTPDHGSLKIGRGFASYFQSYGRITWLHDTSQAWVGVELDGTVTIRSGVPDLGAGQINSLCQITAEVLGVPLEQISVYATDSALTPLAGTSTATRQLYMSGNAVLQAATAVRRSLLERASHYFEEAPEGLDMADGRIFVAAQPDGDSLALAELVRMCASEGRPLANLALFKAPFSEPIDPETGQGRVFPDFTFGALAAEVAVDVETGEVTLLKSAACHDVGRAINPAAAEGQIAGGGTQGLGYALMEDLLVQNGVIRTPSLSEYLLPTSMDFPAMKVIMLESGTGAGPFGAKGIGEPSLTPAAPAVANAVADAIGVHIHELPITAEKVLNAIDGLAQGSRDQGLG